MSGLPHPYTMIALSQQRQAELHDQVARERRSRLASPGASPRQLNLSVVVLAASVFLLAVREAIR